MGGSKAGLADLKVLAVELSDEIHAENDEDDIEQEPRVGEEGVNAEHDKDNGIVAREVAQVVVDTRLDLSEVLGLRHALDVEKLRDRAQVRKAVGEGRRADVRESVAQVEPGGQGVERDLYARHGCDVVRLRWYTSSTLTS